jgi:cell division protein FtsN
MKRNQRYATRSEKRKQNRFLNIAIILVVLLITVVAYNLFTGDDQDPASTSSVQQTGKDNVTKEDNSSIEMESDKDSKSKDNDKENASDSDKQSDSEKEDQSGDEMKTPEGGGPEGPWEPIGTTQSEPHEKSYDDQSQDWKEMLAALSYATNIPQDQMTLFWLGNGGGPDLSKGTVQSKVEQQKYDVQLQWIPEKGWKPVSVTPVQ